MAIHRFSICVLLICLLLSIAVQNDIKAHSAPDIPPDSVSGEPAAAPGNLRIEKIDVGIRGVYKTGYWTPCRVTLKGNIADNLRVTLTMPDPDGTPTIFDAPVVKNQDGATGGTTGEVTASALIRPGRTNGTITVCVERESKANKDEKTTVRQYLAERVFMPSGTIVSHDSGETPASRNAAVPVAASQGLFPLPVAFERPVFLVLSNEKLGLEEALSFMSFRESNRPLIVPVDSFAGLPDDPIAYQAISLVVLTANPKLYEGVTPSDPRLQAMERWLQLGGRLLFNAGQESEPLLAGENALFSKLLPGKFVRMTKLRLAGPIEMYVSRFQATETAPMTMTGNAESPFIQLPYFTNPLGIVEAAEGDLPLVVRSAYGLGTLIYMGGDLGQLPLRSWKDRPILVARLLGATERKSTQDRQENQTLMQLGYNDLAGQLRSALDRFDGVRNLPFSLIILLLVAYLLLVGIGDWFLVHKILKRPQLTWITFPCWITLFCVVAVMVVYRGQPKQVIVNQAELIDIDATSKTARGTAWLGFYSPNDKQYDLHFSPGVNARSPQTQSPQTHFAWFGLPGGALGGMAPKTVTSAQWDAGYRLGSPKGVISRLPMQVRSTRSLTANWETTDYENIPAVADLTEQDGIPSGHLMNSSSFDWEQCFVVYGRWVIELKTIKAGETVEVGTAAKRRDLKTVLAGGRNVFDDERIGSQLMTGRYNTESTNVPYILRSMMFYDAAGGFDEFGMYNAYQHFIDMSSLLQVRRAMVIGVVRQSSRQSDRPNLNLATTENQTAHYGSDLLDISGETANHIPIANRITVLRIVFPVKNTEDHLSE
ncbi:MAG: hypothetical protein FWC50_04660 [Planctomycetaceae bacterium]|nr:hypothetical protein [Planctomycetaceae bacterium]